MVKYVNKQKYFSILAFFFYYVDMGQFRALPFFMFIKFSLPKGKKKKRFLILSENIFKFGLQAMQYGVLLCLVVNFRF